MFKAIYLCVAAICSTALAFNIDEAEQVQVHHNPPTWTLVPIVVQSPTTVPVEMPSEPRRLRSTASKSLPTTTVPPTTTTTLPVWNGEIPAVYGTGSDCTPEEANIVARAMWDRGASDESVLWMLQTISRESICDSSAHNSNRGTGDDSWGLCQQNNMAGWFNEGNLLAGYDRYSFASDFELNARSCALMWSVCGRGPWTYGNYGCSTPKELR